MSTKKKVAIGFDDWFAEITWLLARAERACYVRCRAQGMSDTESAEYFLRTLYEILRKFVAADQQRSFEHAMRVIVQAYRAHGLAVRWPLPTSR